LVAESVLGTAVRALPVNSVAGHAPDIIQHASLANGKTAAAAPGKWYNLAAELAFSVFCPASAFFPEPGDIGSTLGAAHMASSLS